MKRSLLINLILILAVLSLWWWLAYHQSTTFSLSEITDTPVKTIKIHRPNMPDISLQRISSQWQMTEPVKAAASPSRIKLLINLLDQPLDDRIKAHNDFERFGFGDQHLRLQYGELIVGIGDQDPLSGERYLLHDEQVFLTDDRMMPLLSAGAGSFIDHQPLASAESVEKLSLPRRNQQQIIADPQILTRKTHEAIINNWRRATATRVQLNPAGLIPAGQPVTVKFADGKVEHFYLRFDSQLILSTADGTLDYIFPAAMLDALIPATE